LLRRSPVTYPGKGKMRRKGTRFRLKAQRGKDRIDAPLQLTELFHLSFQSYPYYLYPSRVREDAEAPDFNLERAYSANCLLKRCCYLTGNGSIDITEEL